jgi:hypothetical protein
MRIDQSQLDHAVHELNDLSAVEYGEGVNLDSLLSDMDRTSYQRLWRLGRLLGVEVKEPFSVCTDTRPSRETGALRKWDLRPEKFHEPANQDIWQFNLLAALIREPELRRQEYLGPDVEQAAEQMAKHRRYHEPSSLGTLLASWFRIKPDIARRKAAGLLAGSPLNLSSAGEIQSRLERDLHPYLLENAAVEMINERGFFRCMALSLDNHLCMPSPMRNELQASFSDVPRLPSLIGTHGVEWANTLSAGIEWMGVADPELVTGFVILIDNQGVDGFCNWVEVDVRPKFAGAESGAES